MSPSKAIMALNLGAAVTLPTMAIIKGNAPWWVWTIAALNLASAYIMSVQVARDQAER